MIPKTYIEYRVASCMDWGGICRHPSPQTLFGVYSSEEGPLGVRFDETLDHPSTPGMFARYLPPISEAIRGDPTCQPRHPARLINGKWLSSSSSIRHPNICVTANGNGQSYPRLPQKHKGYQISETHIVVVRRKRRRDKRHLGEAALRHETAVRVGDKPLPIHLKSPGP